LSKSLKRSNWRLKKVDSQQTVVMFSGGTDSTLTAALDAQKFDKVHLVTYDRLGLFSVDNTQLNAQKLKDKFGHSKFDYHKIKINKLTKFVFYERYIHNLRKHGFFLLSICGLCKLAMHMRTLIFCLDNKIGNVSDGANQGMNLFPAQMVNVIEELRSMYAKFGVNYSNPVFKFEGPQNIGFADRLHLEKTLKVQDGNRGNTPQKTNTTGCKLHKMGLIPSENVKGTDLDRKMQPRCFQFILMNIFIKWYYLHDHSYEQYAQETLRLYKEKISYLSGIINEYVEKGDRSKLYRLIEG